MGKGRSGVDKERSVGKRGNRVGKGESGIERCSCCVFFVSCVS